MSWEDRGTRRNLVGREQMMRKRGQEKQTAVCWAVQHGVTEWSLLLLVCNIICLFNPMQANKLLIIYLNLLVKSVYIFQVIYMKFNPLLMPLCYMGNPAQFLRINKITQDFGTAFLLVLLEMKNWYYSFQFLEKCSELVRKKKTHFLSFSCSCILSCR